MADFEAIKRQQQQTWSKGDFAMIGWHTVYPGELLCEAVQLRAGEKVLDVATGSGNTALSAARRNCAASGIDYVPALIERARQRAVVESLPAKFEVGDCEQIPFAQAHFDVVLSVFGSMFAPDAERAASELLRVCRPGGRIGLANWTPDGFWGQTFGLVGKYVPPPAGITPPVAWGTAQRLDELFGAGVSATRVERRSALFRFRSSAHWIEVFSRYFGPIIRVRETLDDARHREFISELDATLKRFNTSGDDTLMVSADYLEVVMKRT